MAIAETWTVDDSTFREHDGCMLDSVDQVIDALDGPARVGELCGVGTSAVSNWRKRGRISRGVSMIVRDALAARGKEAAPSVFGFKEAVTEEART